MDGPSPQPIHSLIVRVAEGDDQAFALLYSATSAKLLGVALRISHRNDWAEDILQEAFLRIWDHAADYRPELGAPMTWMSTIVRNRAIDWIRRDRGERSFDEMSDHDALTSADPSPLDWALAGAEARALKACLDELHEKQSASILMSYVEGYTHAEVAERLDSPLGTVKTWIGRGLYRLKECLDR